MIAATAGARRVGPAPWAAAAALWCAALPAIGRAAQAGAARVARAGGGRLAGAGTWQAAIEVPGLGALSKGGNALVNSVSCASAGNCVVAGYYSDGSGHRQAFVASERGGTGHLTWSGMIELPGTGTLNKGGGAGSPRCRGPRQAAVQLAGPTRTLGVTCRPSWPARTDSSSFPIR